MFKSFYHRNLNPNVEKYRDSLLERMVDLYLKRFKMSNEPMPNGWEKNRIRQASADARVKLLKLYYNSLSKGRRNYSKEELFEDLDAKCNELINKYSSNFGKIEVLENIKRQACRLDEIYEIDNILSLNEKLELISKTEFVEPKKKYFAQKFKDFYDNLQEEKKQEIKENELEDDFNRENPDNERNKRPRVTAEDNPSNYNSDFVGGRRKSMKKRKRCSKSKKCRRKK